jgi:hypothetical protein
LIALTVLGGSAAIAHADRREPAKAELAEIGRDGRSLLIRVQHNDGCARDGQATVRETAQAIEVAATQAVADDPGIMCAEALHFSLVRVPLAAPVHGRRVTGLAPLRVAPAPLYDHADLRPLMPRVVGLSRPDALAALQAAGIPARIAWLPVDGSHGEVIAQAPRPHTRVTRAGVARLRVARGHR